MMIPRAVQLSAAALLVAAGCALTTSFSDAAFTSSTASAPNRITAAVDWTPPLVTLTVPATPLSGTAAIDATAEDPEGSATTLRIDVSASGTQTWVEVCGESPSPLSCSWDTTAVEDGLYELRATATDSSGNSTDETATGIVVDNTPAE